MLKLTETVVHEVEVAKGSTQLGVGLKDGQSEDWPAEVVSEVVEDYCKRWSIDTIVTFDATGVSGHTNHRHTYRGVVAHRATNRQKKDNHLEYYHLHTAPLFVKYSSWLAAFFYTLFFRENTSGVMFANKDANIVWESMRAHQSQLVWFRKLYLCFSSYVYVNYYTKY